MKRRCTTSFSPWRLVRSWIAAAFALAVVLPGVVARAADSASVKARLVDPPRQYSSGPLWVWNDMLTEEQIKNTMADLAGQKVKQVFVHPRPGLMTPYLEKDWFRLWKVALAEAERLDMNVWIYDENSYPSGFAGGLVPEAMPESRGKGLNFAEVKQPGKLAEDVLVVYRMTDDSFENVTAKARAGETLPEGRYLVGSIALAPVGGWFGGKYYVDLLKPGVTQKFLEITMGAYEREIGDQFGKRVPGVFTDEPHLSPAGGLHWSDGLAEDFQKRWGYDLMEHLPSLVRPVGDWRRVRHNYQQLLLEEFIDRWAKPFYEYCEKHNLEFTGHYWEHGWPGASHGPDNMAMYAWHQRPSIDNLMNQYNEADVHGQFGNARTVKELSSVANQLGRKRTLCETYGAGGWDLRFEDMKRIGDWIYVLGVNTLNEHLSYVTIRGARKRDHPQSFSYHEPWWEGYHKMAGYFTRLSLVLTEGDQVNHALLLQPTTSAWMAEGGELEALGNEFQDLINRLEHAQAEYDVGCEDILARHGKVDRGQTAGGAPAGLVVGQRAYDLVVLSTHTENLNGPTVRLLEEYLAAGGKVLSCGKPPTRVDGQASEAVTKLAQSPGWKKVSIEEAIAAMQKRSQDGLVIARAKDDQGILFHHRRRLDDGEILFVVNTSIDAPSAGVIESSARGIERWNLDAGTVGPYPFAKSGDGVRTEFNLPHCGSLMLFLSKDAREPVAAKAAEATTIRPLGPPKARRVEPNVLTLDYVDITAGGETLKNVYCYTAGQFAFAKNGMERNPWDSAVQLHDQLITKKFAADSGFEATYRFTIEGPVPKPLVVVIERPDLYTITCNGKPVSAAPGQWWLDKVFGKIDLSEAAQTGANAVTLRASPMTIYHELESAYVLGDFALNAADSGFVIVPPRPLDVGSRDAHVTVPDGTMWLTAGIGMGGADKAKGDGKPTVVFDLGERCDLAAVKVWNYNEVNLTKRGVKEMRVSASPTGEEGSFADLGTFSLDEAQSGATGPSGKPLFPRTMRVNGPGVRFVKFDILSNHHGVAFPTTDGSVDNALVGLAEVQFFAKGDSSGMKRIPKVAIARVSSELGSPFNRMARFLIDGSGLGGVGWNGQGCPFYAAGVSYTETFNVSKPSGRYCVSLGPWYGSTAR
ncbi:MAG: glycosyl hydrolase, partial [Planctomycetia bacterium]|nr:glycosyl hydrolase [Planctomycetia bacterium]